MATTELDEREKQGGQGVETGVAGQAPVSEEQLSAEGNAGAVDESAYRPVAGGVSRLTEAEREAALTRARSENKELSEDDFMAPALTGQQRAIDAVTRRAWDNRPETADETRARLKRERAKKIIGATADGLRAMSNLIFTTQYAPDMYNHEKTSQLKGTMARIDELAKARAARDKMHNDLLLQAAALEAEKGKMIPELRKKYQEMLAEKEKAEQGKAAAELNRKKGKTEDALRPHKISEAEGKASEAKAKGRKAEVEADWQPKLSASEERRNNAQAGAASRSNQLPWRAWDRDGNARWFPSREAAVAFAIQEGYTTYDVWLSTEEEYDAQGHETGSESKIGTIPSRQRETSTGTTGGKASPTGGKASPTGGK